MGGGSGFLFTFVRTHVADAGNILIRFGGTELHDDFGPGGTARGSAEYPRGGDISFDSTDVWTLGRTGSLYQVAVHEIGHALGLQHIFDDPADPSDDNSIMAPGWKVSDPSQARDIDPESEAQIRTLYGWSPQVAVLGPTDTRPAVTVAGRPAWMGEAETKRLLAAWRGNGSDRRLWWSERRDGAWQTPAVVTDARSTHAPGLAALSTGNGVQDYFLIWKGDQDRNIWYTSRYDNQPGWGSIKRVAGTGGAPDPGTATTPAAAFHDQSMWIAWRGAEDDKNLYYSSMIAADTWAGQRRVHPLAASADAPCLVVFRDRLNIFWRGIDDDRRILQSVFDPASNTWSEPAAVQVPMETELGGPIEISPIATTHGPSAVAVGNSLYLAWKGTEGDRGLYVSVYDQRWSGQQRLPERGSTGGPAIAWWSDHLHMLWKGSTQDDTAIWHSFWPKLR